MKPNGRVLYQVFKYTVYLLLTINLFAFFIEEYLAAKVRYPDGMPLKDVVETYAATIDSAAWLILLLMFELETYVLEDRHFTKAVSRSLHALRAIGYVFIVYAFYGYLVNVAIAYATSPLVGVSDVCSLVGEPLSYAIDQDEYVAITAANCASFTELDRLYRFDALPVVVDAPGLTAIRGLAWVDAVNAGIWLLVLLLLEIDVRLQERNRFEGAALRLSKTLKGVFYSALLLAVAYWAVEGDFVDWWDALFWLVAFVFIELNVFEWRQASNQEAARRAASGT